MIRILFFIAVVFGLAAGFAWLADRPGELVVTFAGYQYQVSLMVAAVAVTALVAVVMITWWLLKAIWNSPYTISRYFRVRRRDRGYQALSTGMIAAGAGDAAAARRLNKQAAKFISSDQEPLIHLLDAQTLLLEGDHEGARKKFEAMVEDPEMRVLGLRGLYLEASRLGERQAARHYAARAAEIAPQLAWAADATLEGYTDRKDWDGALGVLDSQKGSDKALANRRRAVLLTAKARDLLERDVLAARNAAVEANRLAPDLIPAAVLAGKALIRQNDVKKASKILEAAWRANPHPDVAAAYVHARPGDATLDRLTRARRLQSLHNNHPESSLAVARSALDAGEFAEARAAAEAAIRMQPREGAFLLLADIEEAETGDQGKIRQLLGRAVRAPSDPAWVADGVVSEAWEPVSPVTGHLDAFEWRVPVERLGLAIDREEPEAAAPAPVLPAPPATPAPVVKPADDEPAEIVIAEPERKPVAETAPAAAPDAVPVPPQPAPASTQPARDVPPPKVSTAGTGDNRPIVRPPDDPGVDPDEPANGETRRFRLF